MKTKKQSFCKALFLKIALLTALILGGGNSAWAQKSLPYSYGFENNDLEGEGWTILNGRPSSTAIVNSGTYGAVVKGSYSFRFSSYDYSSTKDFQYLVSPVLENSTGIDVNFYYNNNSTSLETFCVGYSTTTADSTAYSWEDDITTNDTEWHTYSHSFPTGTKYIAILYKSHNKSKLFIDDISIDISETYKRPKNLSLDSYTSSSATFSWTAGSDESAWQLVYSTDENFDPDDETPIDVTSNPYNLTRLEETTYYAYVRGNYDGNYSEWSNKIEFTPRNEILLNNANDVSTNLLIPTNSTYEAQSQFVIPASSLLELRNHNITSLTFYGYGSKAENKDVSWNTTTFDVFLNQDATEFFSSAFQDWGTMVCNDVVLSINNGEMEIDFDTPFIYESGNLLIGLQKGTTSTPIACSWYGVTESTNTAAYAKKSWSGGTLSPTPINFSPKVLITYFSRTTSATIGSTGYTTFASTKVLDLDNLPSGLTAYYAASDAVEEDKVRLTVATGSVPAGEGLILKGTAGDSYDIPIADGDGTALSGNLLVGCTTPKALVTNANNYVLVNNAGSPEFRSLASNGATIPAGKAYLNAPGAGSRLSIVFDDPVVTGVRSLTPSTSLKGEESIYSLSGQKVAKIQKGIYIQNGKKMVR